MWQKPNIKAAILTIRDTEGTDAPDGYQYLFGSSKHNTLRFTDMSKHPNNLQVHNGISSTAAGIAQILYSTYVELCQTYKFKDFLPHTQELMYCALFDRINVLADISKGYMLQDTVMSKLSGTWASLPYAHYKGQTPKDMATVRQLYLQNGGTFG